MNMLDLGRLRIAPVQRDPFDFFIVPGFVRPDALLALAEDFPRIDSAGSFPADAIPAGPSFLDLLRQLQAPAVADAVGEKLGIDLGSRPRLLTVRGRCQARDGAIHTDSRTKLVTVLIYLNRDWAQGGGRLRLLRSADDIEDYAAEVPPDAGTLLAFRRSERSWHGHLPFVGERRSLQLNWLTSEGVLRRERVRHAVSAALKRILPFGSSR